MWVIPVQVLLRLGFHPLVVLLGLLVLGLFAGVHKGGHFLPLMYDLGGEGLISCNTHDLLTM